MPDWSYRTVLRPLLLRLPAERARRIAVGSLALIGRSAVGKAFIDFLGHMRADPRLVRTHGDHTFPSPVGIGALLDPSGAALGALARFGCGFLEIGPIAGESREGADWTVSIAGRKIARAGPEPTVSIADALVHLDARPEHTVPVFARLADGTDEMLVRFAGQIAGHVEGIVLPRGGSLIGKIRAVFQKMILVVVPTGFSGFAELEASDGVWIVGETEQTVRTVARARAALTDKIIVAGGAIDPAEARAFLEAGATLTSVDAGLALSGPGLVKRINEALLSELPPLPLELLTLDASRRPWFWALMIGLAMIAGGVVAAILATTRVVLPYDEALCGISRGAFVAINPKLLPFMAHDRMSLAATMLSIGVLYSAIAWNAIRRGAHWAKSAILFSAMSGFFSFFLFLGFGYFDPFHAFITAILFQFVVLTLFAPLGPAHPPAVADWRETAAWRRGQWGQLLFIGLGVGLVSAGIVISIVGCTKVLVGTDLEFLQSTAARLLVANDRLMPLIAHDRASLGGMLISNGIVIWLAAQWGIRAGERWLWRALALAGNVAFAVAIGVHLAVGYMDWLHFAPAVAGWCLWLLALCLTREWMCLQKDPVAAKLIP